MDHLMAFLAYRLEVRVVVGQPLPLDRVIRRHERDKVVDILRGGRTSLRSANLAQWVIHELDGTQALPTTAVVDTAPLCVVAALRLRLPSGF